MDEVQEAKVKAVLDLATCRVEVVDGHATAARLAKMMAKKEHQAAKAEQQRDLRRSRCRHMT